MRTPRESIASRIFLPIIILAAGMVFALLLLVYQVTGKVSEDYNRFTVTAAASHVNMILGLAASELTAAKLTDNPVVVEAKKASLQGALQDFWSRSELDGMIQTSGGRLVSSTLDAASTEAILAAHQGGFFIVRTARGELDCLSQGFPLWDWTVITVTRHTPLREVRPEMQYLLPLLAFGALALTAGVASLLWFKLRRPVAEMVAAVEAGREVGATGLQEFDRIGAAVNAALGRVRLRTEELAEELERRRRAEEALRGKEEHIRLLLNSTAEGIYGVNTSGICTFCNPACLRLLGYGAAEELLGKNIHALIHHKHADGTPYPEEECRILLAYRERGGTHFADEVFWRADGKSFPVEYWSYPVIAEGTVTGAVVAFVEITERLALEQQLRQAQKMEAVGRLAGGIAHDFNNMLMAIVGYASLGRDLAEEGSRQRHYHDQVLVAAEKAAELTRQILAFSRRQVLSPAPVDLNGVILGMAKILSRLLGEDIEVGYNLAGGELVALADRGQIEQVLMNLCTNARDAMPHGGRLAFGTQAVVCDQECTEVHGLEKPGRYALITVSDSGLGMDESTRLRIFEPFFTTKELGKGTGLGLSIVYGIVKQHHGQISVYSEPGRGTTFRIYLPLTAEGVPVPKAAAPVEVRGGSETVLLAEDNDDVRALARSVLEGAGYRVLAASDGVEAVRLHAAHADEIALCLFDVVMPRQGGKEALAQIRAARAGVRAIFMSGYAPDIVGDPHAGGLDIFLTKPLLPRELLRRVREALDA